MPYFFEEPYDVAYDQYIYFFAGWGIWTGIIFAVSGTVGLVTAFKPSNACKYYFRYFMYDNSTQKLYFYPF